MAVGTLLNKTLVQISVRGTKFFVYPQRCHDVVVYHPVGGRAHPPNPARPHEVCWVVDGLDSHHTLEIVPARGQSRVFPHVGPRLKIKGTPVDRRTHKPEVQTVTSGLPHMPRGAGHEMIWKYDVVLRRGRHTVAQLDPTVIIKDDP